MEYYAGLDEAGRGPVVGSMIIAITLLEKKTIEELKEKNVKDSKQILPKKREMLKKIIEEKAEYYNFIEFKPKDIDEALNSKSMNLNSLEAKGTAILIKKMIEDLIKKNKKNVIKKIKRITIDLPSNNEKKYYETIKNFLDEKTKIILKENNIKIHLEHKADEKYIEVSAASIIAKVTRDKKILEIKNKIKKDIGSGYPSDPKTIAFLKKHEEEEKKYFRKTWMSYKKLYGEENIKNNKEKNKENQKKLLDF